MKDGKMYDHRWLITTIFCVLASFLGGVFSNQFFQTYNAYAKKTKNSKVVEANEFRVIDTNGRVKATFGMSKSTSNESVPSLRLLSKAYGGNSGILLQSSNYNSMIEIFGENAGISMDVLSYLGDKNAGSATIKVESRPAIDLFSEKSLPRDFSRVELKSGVGSPTKIEFFDITNNHRAILGNITLEEQNTGVTKEYPISLVFFNKKGNAIWKAP